MKYFGWLVLVVLVIGFVPIVNAHHGMGRSVASIPLEPQLTSAPPRVVLENFLTPSSAEAWWPMGLKTEIQYKLAAGVPLGHIEAVGTLTADINGLFTTRPELTGKWNVAPSRIKGLCFNVKLILPKGPIPVVRVILRSSPSERFWYHDIPMPHHGEWDHEHILFSADWTDEEALSRGWKIQEGGIAPVKSWKGLCAGIQAWGLWVDADKTHVGQEFILCLDNVMLEI